MKSNPVLNLLDNLLISSFMPANLTYFWNFGSLLGLCLVIQIVTGFFLACHYIPNVNLAFLSVENIMRNVNYGWAIRYTHANGASFFLFCIFLHIARGLYYSSYRKPRVILWLSGVIIFLIFIGVAFLGYTLVWGAMSFWGATVITNLLSAIPFIGTRLVEFIWGGFSVDNPTLNRFFSIHYLLPFVGAALVLIHLIVLHIAGSGNPNGNSSAMNLTRFNQLYTVKDLLGVAIFFFFFVLFVAFFPNLLGHPDNYIPANPLVTPTHIVPEWYFLPYYAILRSISNKLLGVIAMFLAILALAFLVI